MRRITVFTLIMFFMLSMPLYAVEEQLSEVVVTATKTKQAIEKAPTQVEVVTAEDIKASNVRTVDEALERIPGIYTSRTSGVTSISNKSISLSVRGFQNQSQSLVLLDGQPLNNYEGNVLWWNIPIENIERIEVVKGPMSSLYGGGAMAGVINIITKTDYPLFEFSLGSGSYDTTELSVGHGSSVGDFSYYLTYRNLRQEGPAQTKIPNFACRSLMPSRGGLDDVTGGEGGFEIVPTATGGEDYVIGYISTETTSEAFTSSLTWDIDLDTYLSFRYGYATRTLDPFKSMSLPGTWIGYSEDEGIYTPAEYSPSPMEITDKFFETSTNTYSISYYNAQLENFEFIINAGLVDNYKDLFRFGPSFGYSYCPNSRYNALLQTNITLPFNNTLTIGADYSRSRVSSLDEMYPDEPVTTRGKMLTYGTFLQDQWDAADFLTFYAGVRYDHWKVFDAATNLYYPDTGDPLTTDDKSKSYVSPKFSLVIRPEAKTIIRASAGDAFRGPTIWEVFKYRHKPDGESSMPNPDLDPETVRSYEVSIQRSFFDNFTIGATYFDNNIDDMIYEADTIDIDENGEIDSQYLNVGKGYSRGYELSLDYRISESIAVFADLTHTKTKITDVDIDPEKLSVDILDKKFRDVPEDVYTFGINLKRRGFYSDIIATYVGGDQFYEEDNSDIYDDCSGGYDPHTNVDI
ncbi:MAG: TonB-dependent receptor, partial [Deltaproteobacteria bacterium]|nr:TonB-dependent receptor [Deltaproteobacteria bacterium]